jgi:glycosyltransferase involved in cell wall biosynthesis
MRIIHIVHGKVNPNGANGISRVVYFLNKHEKIQGLDSQIWAIVDDIKNHYTYKRDESVTVECYPRVRLPFLKNEIIERLKAEKDSIDLIHFHLIWCYDKNIIATALKKLGIPFIITTHGTYSKPHAYTGKRRIARILYEKKYLNMATECHTLTREEGTGLSKYGYTGKSFVAYNGYEINEIPKNLNNDYFKEKPFRNKIILLMVSVLRSDKNIPYVIEALSLLPDNLKSQLAFVLVGPDYKGNAAKYRKLAKKLDVVDAFYWIGPLYGKDKYDAIASADGYIMASYSEGFSMAIIDAMICGKPMILTQGCNMNYLADEKFFIKCEPYPQDLAKAITEYLELGEKRYELGRKSKELALNLIRWEKIVEMMKENYQRIIHEAK